MTLLRRKRTTSAGPSGPYLVIASDSCVKPLTSANMQAVSMFFRMGHVYVGSFERSAGSVRLDTMMDGR